MSKWSRDTGRQFLEMMIEDAESFKNHGEVERLQRITDVELSHPSLFRAFVRGACGIDVALDENMIFFYAACAGDCELLRDLRRMELEMRRTGYADSATSAWRAAQDAFWARQDISELERVAESVPSL